MSELAIFATVLSVAKHTEAERCALLREALKNRRDLEIVKHPNVVLGQVCEPVTVFDMELAQLAADMLATIGPVIQPETDTRKERLLRSRSGVGLAAPQVNRAIRLVVVAAPGFPEMAMVNPVIERGKGWEIASEGCLSLPGTRGEVGRYTTIWITYQDLDGKVCNLKAKDFLARVIQHEVDHLDGIEFTDRIAEQTGGAK